MIFNSILNSLNLKKKRLEVLKREAEEIDARADQALANMRAIVDESERVLDVACNARQILDDLDREFEEKTGLKGIDITFLVLATVIQCARWYILDNKKFRVTAKEGDKMVAKVVPKEWHDILLAPVPYDAIKRGGEILENDESVGLAGINHRALTLGHDPCMGWIFGTSNILSDSLTKTNFTSYTVEDGLITSPLPTSEVFSLAMEQTRADKWNLPAAVARQALHFGSDVYTKMGLPIPFIGMVNEDISKTLMANFHIDVYSVARGAAVSAFINLIVGCVHRLFYNPDECPQKLYEVKTRKIIELSNVIAESSNVIYVALTKDLVKLDAGGILVAIYRVFNDTRVIHKIKREYLSGRFKELIRGEPYEFE